MKKYIYDSDGLNLLEVVESLPVCGDDFCDRCGDCLACADEDEGCYAGADYDSHFWVEYQEDDNG